MVSWIIGIFLLLFINFLNFAVVFFTLNMDGSSLKIAESSLVLLCHRMPSRSFWIFEVPLGLCSRCTGLYLSLAFTLIFQPIAKIYPKKNSYFYLIAFLFPMIIDGIFQHYSVYSGSNFLRFSTGAFFGYSLTSLSIISLNYFHQQMNKRSYRCEYFSENH